MRISVGPGGKRSGVDAFTGTLKRPTAVRRRDLPQAILGLLSVGFGAGRRGPAKIGGPPGLRSSVRLVLAPGVDAMRPQLSAASALGPASRETGLRAVLSNT